MSTEEEGKKEEEEDEDEDEDEEFEHFEWKTGVEIIKDKLYLGGIFASQDEKIMKKYNIKVNIVITCDSLWEKFKWLKYTHFKMYDEETEDISQYFNEAYKIIESCIGENVKEVKPVWVNCHAGYSRSPTLMCSYLMKKWKRGVDFCLGYINSIRTVKPNDGFMNHLRKYEKELGIQVNVKEVEEKKVEKNQVIIVKETNEQDNEKKKVEKDEDDDDWKTGNEIIKGKLFLGDIHESQDEEIIKKHDIKVNIIITNFKLHEVFKFVKYHHFEVHDEKSEDIGQYFKATFDIIEKSIGEKVKEIKPVWVNCQAGYSRSPTLVCSYLMKKWNKGVDFCLGYINAIRSVSPNEGFMKHLRKYEEELANQSKFKNKKDIEKEEEEEEEEDEEEEDDDWKTGNEIIKGKLFLGDIHQSQDERFIKKHHIKVNIVITNFKLHEVFKFVKYHHFEVHDEKSEDIGQYFKATYDIIEKSIGEKVKEIKPVWVNCQAGYSRSPTLVCSYLMKKWNKGVDYCLDFMNSIRTVSPNDGFMKHLRKYEKELGIQTTLKE